MVYCLRYTIFLLNYEDAATPFMLTGAVFSLYEIDSYLSAAAFLTGTPIHFK